MINRKLQTYTRIFIAATIGVIIIYDVWVAVAGGTGTTVSHELITWAYRYPILPFALGVVFGHLFWRMPSTPDTAEHDPYVKDLKTKNELMLDFCKWVYRLRDNEELTVKKITDYASDVLYRVDKVDKASVNYDESRREN